MRIKFRRPSAERLLGGEAGEFETSVLNADGAVSTLILENFFERISAPLSRHAIYRYCGKGKLFVLQICGKNHCLTSIIM